MKSIFITLILLLLFSCGKDMDYDSSFYNNTQRTIFDKDCAPLSREGRIWSYKIDNNRWIYKCSSTSFYVVNEKDSIINKVSSPNRIELDWITDYSGSSLIAIAESDKISELIKLDIENDSIISKVQIPSGFFRTSQHPLSQNEIFVYSIGARVCLYDFQNENLSLNLARTSVPPIISKNGKHILYIRNNELFEYDIKNKTEKLIYNLTKERNFNAFSVFFGKKNEYIIKGSKFDGFYPLEDVEFLVINGKKKLRVKDLKIYRGFRYK